jgi:hypothetical protein
MSTSEEIAPDRLEALLRGEAGTDGRERRIGALLDELTVGEIAPPAELRERVRSLRASAPAIATAPRRLRRVPRIGRRGWRALPAVGLMATAVIVGVVVTQNGANPTTADPNLKAADSGLTGAIGPKTPVERHGVAVQGAVRAAQQNFGAATLPSATTSPTLGAALPAPDGQRAQDYAASLRLAVGSVAELSRSTQNVLDTVHSLGGAVESVDYGTPSAGSGSALIALRIPVGRAQDALRAFSALGTITSQQVQIRDLQTSLDQETNRARALRHRIALQQAKLLSPTLTPEARATLESNLADSQTALESVLRGVRTTQQRAAFARFSLELVTGSGTAVVPPPRRGAFDRTAHDALGVISVAGRGALFAAIVGGPFLLVAAAGLWLSRRLRRRAARRLLESS